MNHFFLISFLLSIASSSAYSSTKSWIIQIPSSGEQSSSIDFLRPCLGEIEKEWLFSEPLSDISIIQDSLYELQNTGDKINIELKTHSLFEALHKRHIAFLPPPFPKLLVIMINRENALIKDNRIIQFIQSLDMPSQLVFNTPLWDLEEYKDFDPRELKGYLSENYHDMMQKYSADYLLIVHQDSLRSLWDLRLITVDREELIHQRCSSLPEVRGLLSKAILSQYSLSSESTHQIFVLKNGVGLSPGLLEGYKILEKKAEILYPMVNKIDSTHIEYELITYWNPRLTALIQKKMSA